MDFFSELVDNRILITALTGWLIAQIFKVILSLIVERKLDFSRFTGAGGMPSSHSALVMALAVAVGRSMGFGSVQFAIAFVFAGVVMYDASGVRRAVGQQAKILNMMVEHWQDDDIEFMNKKLKELLGHTPVEVFAGAILGIMIAVLMPI